MLADQLANTTEEDAEREPSPVDSTAEREALEADGLDELEHTEGVPRAAETFDDWFGSEDATLVTLRGHLGPAAVEDHQHELYVGSEPLSASLSPDELPYYREVFLPTLLRDGRASWRGTEEESGRTLDGAVVTLTREGVEITFGERVDAYMGGTREALAAPRPDASAAAEQPGTTLDQDAPIAVDLDVLMRETPHRYAGS